MGPAACRAAVCVVVAAGAAVVLLEDRTALPGSARLLLGCGLAALATYLARTDRTGRRAPWLARAGALTAAGLWAVVVGLWLLPVAATAEHCGSVLLPRDGAAERGSVCAWLTGNLYSHTVPALLLATALSVAAAAGTVQRRTPAVR